MFPIKTQLKLTPPVAPGVRGIFTADDSLSMLLGRWMLPSGGSISSGTLLVPVFVHLYIFDYTAARQTPLIVFDWSKRKTGGEIISSEADEREKELKKSFR